MEEEFSFASGIEYKDHEIDDPNGDVYTPPEDLIHFPRPVRD